MDAQELRDDQWARLAPLIPGGSKGKRGPRSDGRRFLNGLLWLARAGARWRDLPERFGAYQTVKRRYYRWIENGVLERIFKHLTKEADFERIQIDATVIRAHRHAAGAPLKKGALHPKDWAAPRVASPPNSCRNRGAWTGGATRRRPWQRERYEACQCFDFRASCPVRDRR